MQIHFLPKNYCIKIKEIIENININLIIKDCDYGRYCRGHEIINEYKIDKNFNILKDCD